MGIVGEILAKSGYSNILSILGGFRGPREVWFKGTFKEYLFKFHGLFGLILAHLVVATVVLTFVLLPDVDLSKVLFLAMPMTTTIFSMINLYYMEFYRSKFIMLLKMNEAASYDEIYYEELDLEIKKWSGRANKLQHLICFVVSVPVLPWGMVPVVNEILGSPWGPRRVALNTWFPFDHQQNPYWILTLTFHTVCGLYATLTNVMFNGVFLCISFRQLALLVHLKKTFPKILEVIHTDSKGRVWYTNYTGRKVERYVVDPEITDRLKNWIKRHQIAQGLLKELESLYSVPLFMFLCYTGTVLATGSAAILTGDLAPLELYFITMFLLGVAFTLLIICRVGDYIKIETNEIVDGLCGQNYFLLSKQQHTLLKNFLTFQRKGFELSLVKTFPLTTESFKSVIGTTYSFFAMFIQMQKKN